MLRLRLEATPLELEKHGHLLMERLAKALEPHAPALAEGLSKAIVNGGAPDMHHRALADGLGSLQDHYRGLLKEMLDEIGEALDERVKELAKDSGLAHLEKEG